MKPLPRRLADRLWAQRWQDRGLRNQKDIGTVESRLVVGPGGSSYNVRRRNATVGLVASVGVEFAPGDRVQMDTFREGTAISIAGPATPEQTTTRAPESVETDVTNYTSLL